MDMDVLKDAFFTPYHYSFVKWLRLYLFVLWVVALICMSYLKKSEKFRTSLIGGISWAVFILVCLQMKIFFSAFNNGFELFFCAWIVIFYLLRRDKRKYIKMFPLKSIWFWITFICYVVIHEKIGWIE